jgi:hypothetical protein
MSVADVTFWPKVRRGGPDECWLWTASVNRKGYGQFGFNGRCRLAHRVAYQIVNGSIPNGLCVLHRCDIPACVNPAHLFVGSKSENNADMRAKGRAAVGEACGTSKLTRDAAAAIRGAVGPHAAIAAMFGVHQSTVTRIKSGRIWVEAQV